MKVFRYVTNDEGVWSAGKRLLPKELVDEANKNREWLSKPSLPEGNFRFWLTEKGRDKYVETLLKTHKKYLENIVVIEDVIGNLGNFVYKDEYQVVEVVK